MVVGNVEMNDPYCAGIAEALNVLVASVEYRLGALSIHSQRRSRTATPGCAGSRRRSTILAWTAAAVAIGGGSAGGGLAAGLALVARDRGED